jgi:myo-inositol-1(or 4)-monophosphatase
VSRAVDAAVAAARQAGELLLGSFGSLAPADIQEKSKNDLVSKADRESEALIRSLLLGAFPGDRFLGEEGGASEDGDPDAPTWIVDPLDGTANFVRCFPHWAVSIGRTEKGSSGPLTIGVIWDPVKKDMFVAERGAGAYRNDKRLTAPSRESLAGAAIATGFPFRQQAKIDLYLALFKQVFLRCRSLRRAGSAALDLAYTAAGVFDGFFEFGLSPWDTAAGAVLVREAGGVISDFDGGERWRERGNILAGAPGVHRDLVEVVRSAGAVEERL